MSAGAENVDGLLGALERAAAPRAPRWIVAEVSRNWPPTSPGSLTIAQRLEKVLATNEARGYRLHSWRLTSAVVEDDHGRQGLVETIVAVFERAPTITLDHGPQPARDPNPTEPVQYLDRY